MSLFTRKAGQGGMTRGVRGRRADEPAPRSGAVERAARLLLEADPVYGDWSERELVEALDALDAGDARRRARLEAARQARRRLLGAERDLGYRRLAATAGRLRGEGRSSTVSPARAAGDRS